MSQFFDWLFTSQNFMPHGHCFLWQPATLWLNVGSDGLIAAAYYAIPFTLYYFVRQRRSEIPFPWMLLMFAAFIFLCGSTHIMEIWTVWRPNYRAAGALKLITGIVSFATTVTLFWLVPQAMRLRSPRELTQEVRIRTAELAAVNARLREEIAARDLAHAQLRELDQRKDQFLATLAHELRNPLAPILHAAHLLAADAPADSRQRWGREVILRQAERMGHLLDDLLNVSRITRGRLELKREPSSLAAIVNAAVETSAPLIERRRHELKVSLPQEPVAIDVDPLRLSQALSNLLTNAAKFTPMGGHIELIAEVGPHGLDIAVADDGVGFDDGVKAHLFEMFSQAHGTPGGDESGLGIGLALVKGLTELHGGTVEARSQGPGCGARFMIHLPESVIAAAPQPAAAESSAPAPSPPQRLRVLVADDNRDAADSLGLVLESAGYEVAVTHGGRDALDLARTLEPDVLILDIGMPDLTGYELAGRIRGERWGARAFLLAVTGWGQPDDKARARAAGFDHHLTKPVHPGDIEKLLESLALRAAHPGTSRS